MSSIAIFNLVWFPGMVIALRIGVSYMEWKSRRDERPYLPNWQARRTQEQIDAECREEHRKAMQEK